ncbi:MAG: hypothetical protein AB7O97_15020 [Planctomycetota bacterium]
MSGGRALAPRRRRAFALAAALLSTAAALVLGEVALRAGERWMRRDLPDYGDTWREGGLGPGGFLREGFSATVVGERGGVRWHNNAQGLRYDRDLQAMPPAGAVRVLFVGDSFAAGYRTDQQATCAHRLEVSLRARGVAAELPIAVVEEPVTGLFWLSRHGEALRPDAVVLCLCLGNDVAQAFAALHERGGFTLELLADGPRIERSRVADPVGFGHGLDELALPRAALWPDAPAALRRPFRSRLVERLFGELPRPIAPWYGRHRPHRLFDVYHGLGCFLRTPPREVEIAFERLLRALEGWRRWCEGRGVRFAILPCPQRYQVQPADWQAMVEGYGLVPDAFALDLPNERLRAWCERVGVALLDPTEGLRRKHADAGGSLYLPRGDMHWNAAGHAAAAAAVVDGLAGLLAH